MFFVSFSFCSSFCSARPPAPLCQNEKQNNALNPAKQRLGRALDYYARFLLTGFATECNPGGYTILSALTQASCLYWTPLALNSLCRRHSSTFRATSSHAGLGLKELSNSMRTSRYRQKSRKMQLWPIRILAFCNRQWTHIHSTGFF